MEVKSINPNQMVEMDVETRVLVLCEIDSNECTRAIQSNASIKDGQVSNFLMSFFKPWPPGGL